MQPTNRGERIDKDWNQTNSPSNKIIVESKDIRNIKIEELATNTISTNGTIINNSQKSLADVQVKELNEISAEEQDYFLKDLPPICYSANHNDWDALKEQLKNSSIKNLTTDPFEGPYNLFTLLQIATENKQWDIVETINAKIAESFKESTKNLPKIWHKAWKMEWADVRQELRLLFSIDIHACPLEGLFKGMTIKQIATNNKQWDIVEIINAKIAESFKETTQDLPEIWHNAWKKDWDAVKEQIKHSTLIDMNASPAEGPLIGLKIAQIAATNNQWDLVETINSKKDEIFTESTKDLPKIWHSAWNKDWDTVKKQLKNSSIKEMNACPLEGLHKGMNLLLIAAHYHQWEIIKTILKLYPTVDIDASLSRGRYEHLTLLWWAVKFEQWDIVETIFDLNPNIKPKVDDDTPSIGPYKGMTILWLAVDLQNWILADKILNLYKGLNVHARPSSKIVSDYIHQTVLYLTLIGQQWSLAEKMLKYDLKGNIETFKEMDAVEELCLNNAPNSIVSYLTILGFDGLNIEQNEMLKPTKKSIFNTLNKIVTFFYDSWNNPSKKPFPNFYNNDLIEQTALQMLFKEQPALKTFSPSVILRKIKDYSVLTYKNNHAKALNHIATLAFNEFRWQNGLSDQNYTKEQINNYKALIIDSLKEFEQTHEGIKYTKEKREQIIKKIGKDQNIDSPSFEKTLILKKITKVMSVLKIPFIENLNHFTDNKKKKNLIFHPEETINTFRCHYITSEDIENEPDHHKALLLQTAFDLSNYIDRDYWDDILTELTKHPEYYSDAQLLLQLLYAAITSDKEDSDKLELLDFIFKFISQSDIDRSCFEGPLTTYKLLEEACIYMNGGWNLVRKTLELNPKVNVLVKATGLNNLKYGNDFVDTLQFPIKLSKDNNSEIMHFMSLIDLIMLTPQINYNEDLSAIMSYLIVMLGIDGPKGNLQWQERVKSIPLDLIQTNLNHPWRNPLGEALIKLFERNPYIPNDSLDKITEKLLSLPPYEEWEERAKTIIHTFDEVTASFNDPWLDPSRELFQNLLESLTTQSTLDAIYEVHPELKTFPSSVLMEKIRAFAINKNKTNHEKAINEIASLAFDEFRQKNALLNRNYTEAQIKDYHRLIVTCLEEFKEIYADIPFSQENIKRIVQEIGKDQHTGSPKLKKSFIEKAIRMIFNEEPVVLALSSNDSLKDDFWDFI